jgi:predicted unusual protein kinase regulating ubiquinone biosynthesis (AarF/ABC1/UbiB family)
MNSTSAVSPSTSPTLSSPRFESTPLSGWADEDVATPNPPLKPAEPPLPASEALRYDPIAIAAHYQRRPFQVLNRIFQIVIPFASFGLTWWMGKGGASDPARERRRAIWLREILTRLGPAFIKVGQALSTRPDLVPPVYLEELALLQDQLPPFDNEIAYRFIEEELGDRPENIYAELSEKPIAAASLGQVYKGKLKTGETVAVKVQRPGLAQRITLDIYIMRGISALMMRYIKQVRSNLVAITDEFAARIFEEMDYTQEGRNAEQFDELYGKLPDIYVPNIYWQYTGRRVLTMEWITGTKLTQLDAIREQGIDATHLINVGVQCSLRQLLEHGFFHADPHPGNLLAMPDGRLAYLDFGMMSRVEPYQRYGLIEAIVHLVNRDFEGLAKDYVKLEFLSPDMDLTPIVPAFAEVFNEALSATVAEINIKSITDKMSALMYEYPFQVPAFFALIVRSLVTLEGIAINVDPEFKVLSKAYPYVAKRLLTDPAPELRASLRDLLFKDGGFRWNRLENLLRNARDNSDYNLSLVLNQTTDYLFSDRGELIRMQLVDAIVRGLDTLGNNALRSFTYTIGERFGLAVTPPAVSSTDQKTLEHIQRIWGIVQETKGFDPFMLVPIVPRLLFKPETHRMGQQIVEGLAQRAIARFIREFLVNDSPAIEDVAPPAAQPRLSPASR